MQSLVRSTHLHSADNLFDFCLFSPSAELQPPLRHVVPFKSLNVPGLLRLHVLIEACRPLTAAT